MENQLLRQLLSVMPASRSECLGRLSKLCLCPRSLCPAQQDLLLDQGRARRKASFCFFMVVNSSLGDSCAPRELYRSRTQSNSQFLGKGCVARLSWRRSKFVLRN